jgi:hypothetical protein
LNILQACQSEKLFGPWFRNPETYAAWFAFLAALFGLPMTPDQLAIYQRHTNRQEAPSKAQREAWLVIGRRGGKSFVMALVAVYLACFFDYRQYLSPGERATVIVIAADKKQARVIMRYVRALLNNIPMLKAMVENDTTSGVDLNNFVTIEVGTASFRSTRGYTYAAVLADEIAFWPTDDAADPDFEILKALKPGMKTIPNSMLICASSPYGRRGALWQAFKDNFGKEDRPLVWQAATADMNPTVDPDEIAKEYEEDPSNAAAEYGGMFRTDIEDFVSREAIDKCVSDGIHERPPVSGVKYVAFVDPSGGAGGDSFTLAIAHGEDKIAVVDAIRERRPPYSPKEVVAEFADVLKTYHVSKIIGDRWGGEWPVESFKGHGISYEQSAKPKSDIYRDLLPILNSGQADLLDHKRAITQIATLERRTARGGKDNIDHAPGAHDDVANAVAGVICLVNTKAAPMVISDAVLAAARNRPMHQRF